MQIKNFVLTSLLAASILPAVAADTGGNTAKVRHRIEVETEGGRVLARVTVENHSGEKIYFPREIAAEPELSGRRFDVRELPSGTPLDYTGRMVKRGPPTAADFQALGPHEVHLHTIDITNTYAFKKGRHSYELRYDGPWLADVTRLDQVNASPSAPVRFSYTGK